MRILVGLARSFLRRKLLPPGFRWEDPRGQPFRETAIRTGISEDRALQALGAPDETCPFGEGDRLLTLWVYDRRDEPVYLWVDETGKVKMTCRTRIDGRS